MMKRATGFALGVKRVRRRAAVPLSVFLILCVVAVCFERAPRANADPAPQWPDAWIAVDDDAIDVGGHPYRDVVAAYIAWDEDHLYLRLETAAPPDCSLNARYSWFLGVGESASLGISGNTVGGGTHLLFVENGGDGACATYLLSAAGDDTFETYQGFAHVTNPGPAAEDSAGCRVEGNYMDMYVALSALAIDGGGHASPFNMQLVWAANQMTGTLTQLVGDSPDDSNVPLSVTPPLRVELATSPEPVDAGDTLTYVATVVNLGAEALLDAAGSEFEVAIPTHTTFVPDSLEVNGVAGDPSAVYDAEHCIVTWNGGLEVGASVEIVYEVVVVSPLPNGTAISSQAIAWYDSNGDGDNDACVLSDDSATAALYDPTVSTVVSMPDLVVEVPDRLRRTSAGATRTFEVALHNDGNEVAESVVLDLELDEGLALVSVQPSPVGEGIWEASSLSPIDGAISVRVTVGVNPRLRDDADLSIVATLACGSGESATATTVLPAYVPEDSGSDDSSSVIFVPPEPEEEPHPSIEDDETEENDTSVPPPSAAPSVALHNASDSSGPGAITFTLSLSTSVTDVTASWLYFRLPDGVILLAVTPLQGSVCAIDGNEVLLSLVPESGACDVAVITVKLSGAPGANTVSLDMQLCPVLYVVLQGPEMAPAGNAAGLHLSVFNVGRCTAADTEVHFGLPVGVSVASARVQHKGVVSVTGHEVVAKLGTMEQGADTSLALGVVDRVDGGVATVAADLLAGVVPDVSLSAG